MTRHTATLFAFLSASCANYDFANARLPSGAYDMPKLIADLQATGKESLYDMVWIPLIYQRVQVFRAADAGLPPGYKMVKSNAVGPLYFAATAETHVVDEAGKPIEFNDHFWLGWALLFNDVDEYVQTPHGTRLSERWRLCVLLGNEHKTYARRDLLQAPAADTPTGAKP